MYIRLGIAITDATCYFREIFHMEKHTHRSNRSHVPVWMLLRFQARRRGCRARSHERRRGLLSTRNGCSRKSGLLVSVPRRPVSLRFSIHESMMHSVDISVGEMLSACLSHVFILAANYRAAFAPTCIIHHGANSTRKLQ